MGDEAYLIKSGSVDILVVRDGNEKVVDQVGPGDVFGEMMLGEMINNYD